MPGELLVELRSWGIAGALAVAGALGAAGWRVGTSSYGGADIGGPVVLFLGPLLIAGLLVTAVWLAGGGGRWRLRRTGVLTVAALLVVPAMCAAMYALSQYDAAKGLITAKQYVDVRIGQSRAAVHQELGREGTDDFAMLDFPPVAPGLLCDYCVEVDEGGAPLSHAYQFCFRAGRLVSKDLFGGAALRRVTGDVALGGSESGVPDSFITDIAPVLLEKIRSIVNAQRFPAVFSGRLTLLGAAAELLKKGYR